MRRALCFAALLCVATAAPACSDDDPASGDAAASSDGGGQADGTSGQSDGGGGQRDSGGGQSDGSGGGASTGPLKCSGYETPSFSKACSKPTDCVVALHQIDCCGTHRAIGIAASEKATFDAEEKKCAATYPGCGCPTLPPLTEDGSRVTFDAKSIGVDCVDKICRTFATACGQLCGAGLSCKQCQAKGATYAACSVSCTGDGDCKDPKLPKCESDGRGGKFCTAGNVGCGTQ